ncbi:hypothetical protein SAMN05920897_10534 [Alkalispirochaeta americana]|uniref:Uncharacterized protein n=1 Tax=Alkalispirochaeta americana TaxID=159291 RepID=A0A1N6QSU1_9SPIO|nr:hypothetical protein [Alkalispirochaeta americana]SIQ19661.1 hypothetical protein SAMN05920897_10534 [Alkalispirochaeta americana]
MKGFTITLLFLIGAGTIAAWAHSPVREHTPSGDLIDPPGRVVAAQGTMDTLSGNLVWEDQEWHLRESSSSRMYELHMGPYGHQEEPLFSTGATATVKGFVLGGHIAPVSVESEGSTREFWTPARIPRWAGSGEGEGRVAWERDDVPQGHRLAVADPGNRANRESADDAPRLLRNRRTDSPDSRGTPQTRPVPERGRARNQ